MVHVLTCSGESARVTVFLEEDSIFESVVLDRHTISGSGLLELLLVLGVISGEIEIASVSTSPGSSPGTLTFSGDYNLDTNAVQTLEIGGLTPGTEHDHLIFNDSLTLGGTLDIR